MIAAIKALFQNLTPGAPATVTERDMHLVSAALMAEVMLSDGQVDAIERRRITNLLEENFQLNPAEVEAILSEASTQARQATSLFEFTDQINRHFNPAQKIQLIEHLWQVAYADDELHKFEEATIRKVAELIYVPHSDFIRTKQRAREQ